MTVLHFFSFKKPYDVMDRNEYKRFHFFALLAALPAVGIFLLGMFGGFFVGMPTGLMFVMVISFVASATMNVIIILKRLKHIGLSRARILLVFIPIINLSLIKMLKSEPGKDELDTSLVR
jgi:uncharacterized membrane protein YhaH (DUF805 family)